MRERLSIYTLYDRRLREYGQLSIDHNDESFKRSLNSGLVGSKGLVEKYPEDFDVYCLGFYESSSGEILFDRRMVCGVADVLKEFSGPVQS